MATVTAGFTPESLERFHNTMKYLRLSPQERNKTMQKILWRMKDNAKKNVTHQRTPDGTPWKPRLRKRKGVTANKMLKQRGKQINSKLERQGEQGRLHYADNEWAKISAVHQYGLRVDVEENKQDNARLKKLLEQNDQPATPKQAKRLKELGYKVSSGKRNKTGKLKYKKTSGKNIRQTLSRGRAGLLIRILEEKQGINIRRNLSSYKMTARPFLDENTQRNAEIITDELFKSFERSGVHLTL